MSGKRSGGPVSGTERVRMKNMIRHVLALGARMIVLHLCCFPVILIAGRFALPDRTPQLAALMLALSWLGILIGLVPKKTYMEVLVSLVLSGAAAHFAFGMWPRAFAAFILLYAVTHIGMRSAHFAPEEGLPSRAPALGLGTYILLPALYRLEPSLREHAGLHSFLAVAAVAAAIFLMNRTLLYVANLQGRTGPGGVSADIRLKNALYAAGLLAAIVAVASIRTINRWLSALWDAFAAWLSRLGGEPGEPAPDPDFGAPGGMPMLPAGPEIRKPSPFWEMVQEIVVHLVSGLAILAALGVIGHLVIAKLVPLLRRLAAGLNRERRAELDYLDETEKLETPDIRAVLRRTVGRMKRRPPLPDDPRERVRARYRMMLELAARDGLAPDAAMTPSETAAKLEAAGWRKKPVSLVVELYNPVRYGEKDADPAALAELERAWDERRDRS